MNISSIVIKATVSIIPIIIKELKEYNKNPHGSKVKEGAFKGNRISILDNESCILVDSESIVPLTSDYVKICKYDKKKFRIKMMKDYYYFNIVFTDDRRSYIRVSEKHLKNLSLISNPY